MTDRVFQTDGVTIHLGDCREVLKSLPDCSVNCCVTSPPYWGLRDYGHDDQLGQEATPEGFVDAMNGVFREVRRVLTDDGTLWLNLGDSYAAQRGGTTMPAETLAGGVGGKGDFVSHRGRQIIGAGTDAAQEQSPSRNKPIAHRNCSLFGLKHKDLVGIPWRVALALQADGWYLRQDIIWHKPNPMPESVRDRCTKSHEYIFLLSKSERYYFDHEAIKEASVEPDRVRADRVGGASHEERQQHSEGGTFTGSSTRNKRSVWTVATKPYPGAHFAVFPPELIEPCITAGCPEGGTVLDPFTGSGTTAEVARRYGCKFIGCELNPNYLELAKARFDQSLLPFPVEAAQ